MAFQGLKIFTRLMKQGQRGFFLLFNRWSEINPVVEPVAITERPGGKVEVLVNQLVKDMEGNVIFHGQVKHIYIFTDDFIFSMDIEAS